jgi:hypothetical protein
MSTVTVLPTSNRKASVAPAAIATPAKPVMSVAPKVKKDHWTQLIENADDIHVARVLFAYMQRTPQFAELHVGVFLAAELRVKRAQRYYAVGRSLGCSVMQSFRLTSTLVTHLIRLAKKAHKQIRNRNLTNAN